MSPVNDILLHDILPEIFSLERILHPLDNIYRLVQQDPMIMHAVKPEHHMLNLPNPVVHMRIAS